MNNLSKTRVLENISWGKPAAQLLTQCKTLVDNKPAVMIIRHSERANIEKPSEVRAAGLTETGREAARVFGQLLPENRRIRLYHSPVSRCRETAECILEGAVESGKEAELLGGLGILEGPRSDFEKFSECLIRDWPNSINFWLSGRYHSSMVESSLDYSKRASLELGLDRGVDSGDLVLYVAHDLPILGLLFHWFGVLPSLEYASFLNGFMCQRLEGRVSLFFKGTKVEVDLPYWWDVK
jgi:broad specificity phosphatase PhoE